MSTPALPDGIVAVVKRDCPTCEIVAPVLAAIQATGLDLTVYTQDDPTFPSGTNPVDDTELAFSYHHAIETVPTLLRVENGKEVARTEGWFRPAWEKLTGIDGLGPDLAELRPGCGSLSVDEWGHTRRESTGCRVTSDFMTTGGPGGNPRPYR